MSGAVAGSVLVTGASGFLGSHLCAALRAGGAEVHAVSRSQREGDIAGLRWWASAFDDAVEIDRILSAVRPTVVYHLGGHVTAAPEIGHVVPTFESLLASTVHVLVRATALGAQRIVLAASATEPRDGRAPGSPYAAAKWCANVYAHMCHALYGTPVVVTRPYWVYGPGQRQTKLIPYVITSLLQGRAPRLASGTMEADWVYVDDVIDGLLEAGTNARAVGAEIDLGTGRLVSVREIVELIVDLVKPTVQPDFGALQNRPAEEVRAAEVERAFALLGWRATTSLRTGLARTIAWHRGQLEGAGARQEG